MFGIGSAELFVILLIAFFIVGPQRLPEVARMLGKVYRSFKRQADEINQAMFSEQEEDDLLGPPENNPREEDLPAAAEEREKKVKDG